jgi:cell fate regulator YaaT (PSP1 superfamily)
MKIQNKNFFFARVFSDTNLYKVAITDDQEFRYGSEVIIHTEFGLNIAVVTSFKTTSDKENIKSYPCGKLVRYATIEDKAMRALLDKKSILIKAEINKFVQSLHLDMNLTNILISLSESSMCIYYTAKGRVDFRALLVKLKSNYKAKIILRQISSQERKSSFLCSSSDLYFL